MTALPLPPFTVTPEAGPGTARLRLTGDLDYDTSGELARAAEECLAADPHLADLHLDCAQLRLCDSMGVATLLLIHRGATTRGVRLHVESPPPFLTRILDVTGIGHLFALGAHGQESAQERTDDGATPS
ncbi:MULTISPECIES: STAS domain-containing protein [Streptomyces]|uniref:STAS domain-containing protein n=2 Tax=Streptomyces TaxID=1883 RepID=A0ABU2RSN4_9ACTN|nr:MULTISPECIES: STAS domain-containing protein [unclassified Streptomyces]MBK3591061.1 STAS domain-containing protein [Streptomyces sp. MBT51]MDT0431847.1 STAS domain-containing protein [Streptomyces sp. DSM 41770]HBF83276.1 anti-sigma factor antagonist [Streptomyces sp.]